MTEGQAEVAAQPSRLEALAKRLHYDMGTATPQQKANQAFDSASTYDTDRDRLRRISQGPKSGTETTSTGTIHSEMAGIQLELAELADQYGKLNVRFGTLIGKDKIYTVKDVARIAYNKVVRDRKKVLEIKKNAAGRKGDNIEKIVNMMAEVLEEQHQKAIDGKARSETIQVENVAHMKYLDRKLIDSLKNGHYRTADQAEAELEVVRLVKEISDIDQVLEGYQSDVMKARGTGNIQEVVRLTDEMSQVLDMKHQILDGQLSAERLTSEIRRQILDSSEAVQSSKGAIAASKVNYRAINALVDSLSELEIKYRHAKEDMVPVFKIQGKIAAGGLAALDMRDTLLKVSAISERLMEANARMVMHLAAESFELLQTPLYDPVKAQATEERLRLYMTDLNQKKMEWAENMQQLGTSPTAAPHYGTRK